MHPFLDVKSLSDEELIERLNRAYNYRNAQKDLGHVPTVMSIDEVIRSLEGEQRDRMEKITTEEDKKRNPGALKPIELGKLE